MYTCPILLVAQGKSIDVETQALSIFNVFEGIGAISFPVVFPNIFVIAFLNKDDSDLAAQSFDLVIRLKSGDTANDLHHFPMNVQFASSRRAKTSAQIQGLPIHSEGKLIFALQYSGADLATYEVDIAKIEKIAATPVIQSGQ